MKAKIFATVCILLVLCMGCVFAQEMTIDEFLDGFEALVVDVEEAAEEGDFSNYLEFVSDYADFLEIYQTIDMSNWTYEQMMEYSDLCVRYSVAISELSDSTDDVDFDEDDLEALYGAYADLYSSYGF